VWDDETWAALTVRHARLARTTGDLSELPLVLNSLAVIHLLAGEQAAAASVLAEVEAINEATGAALASYARLALAAWHGDEATAAPLIEASLAEVTARGEGTGALATHWAYALLLNGLGRYPDAIAPAQAAAGHPVENGVVYWALCELVEAAVRGGRPELAAEAYERLAEVTRACGTDWALGVRARCGALLATGAEAEAGYREAIERLGRTRIRADLARAHLLYGEWLRRENRRHEARGELRTAYEMLTAAAAGAFADRARRELAATGESTADRAVRAHDGLTPQEATIAGLAGSGLTNVEIGARLFLSPHTVEWHLRKVFTKLGVTSRRQLRPPAGG
jgi:DNA-binding CsgD family transcriptional regulator